MTMQPGVKLNEKGKVTSGQAVRIPNKFNLADYLQLKDPRSQQAASNGRTIEKMKN